MNPKKILTISAVALLATTMIVACGPKDRSGTPVSKSAAPPATPTNTIAADQLKAIKDSPAKLKDALLIAATIKDISVVASPTLAMVRVVRDSSLKDSTVHEKETFVFTTAGATPGSGKEPLKLVQVGSNTSTIEVGLYPDSSGGVDSIRVKDISDSTKTDSSIIYRYSQFSADVTPADQKALTTAIAAATDADLIKNLTSVRDAFSNAESAGVQPIVTDLRFESGANQSYFQAIMIPAAPKDPKATAPAIPDLSRLLVGVSMEIIKGAGSASLGTPTTIVDNAEAPSVGFGISDLLSVPMKVAVSTAEGYKTAEADVTLSIENKVGGVFTDFKLHFTRNPKDAKGGLHHFGPKDSGATAATTADADGSTKPADPAAQPAPAPAPTGTPTVTTTAPSAGPGATVTTTSAQMTQAQVVPDVPQEQLLSDNSNANSVAVAAAKALANHQVDAPDVSRPEIPDPKVNMQPQEIPQLPVHPVQVPTAK